MQHHVVAALFGFNVSSRLSQGGFDAPSEQSVHAASVLASEFHNGSDNIVLLVHVTSGTVDSAAVRAAGRIRDLLMCAHDRPNVV